MKRPLFLFSFLLSISVGASAQVQPPAGNGAQAPPPAATNPSTQLNIGRIPANATDYGWSDRFGFIVGVGGSTMLNPIYENVAIERAGNTVVIDKAGKFRSTITLGIAFTPFPYTTERTFPVIDDNGRSTNYTDYKYYPRGFTVGVFFNPISLTSISNTTFTPIDFGFGLGYRTGDIAFLATLEAASVRQPRDSFIATYEGKGLQYKVDGNIQTSIDVNDNSVYRTIVRPSIGFKIAYTISLFKQFQTATHQ